MLVGSIIHVGGSRRNLGKNYKGTGRKDTYGMYKNQTVEEWKSKKERAQEKRMAEAKTAKKKKSKPDPERTFYVMLHRYLLANIYEHSTMSTSLSLALRKRDMTVVYVGNLLAAYKTMRKTGKSLRSINEANNLNLNNKDMLGLNRVMKINNFCINK